MAQCSNEQIFVSIGFSDRVFSQPSCRYIAIYFKNYRRPVRLPSMQDPIARYYEALTALGMVNQLSFPLTGSLQLCIYFAARKGKLSLKEQMRILPQRFVA